MRRTRKAKIGSTEHTEYTDMETTGSTEHTDTKENFGCKGDLSDEVLSLPCIPCVPWTIYSI